jgi:hypothetical protein
MRKREQTPRRLPRSLIGVAIALFLAASLAGGASSGSKAAPVNTDPPTISGTPQEGKTLRGNPGTWTGSPKDFDYQWLRCSKTGGSCSQISDAGSREYTVASNDVGNTLRVRVTATNADGSANATSVPSAVVKAAPSTAPQRTSNPTISGTPQQGQTLTASTGDWNGTQPITFSFQWQRCDANGNSCAAIPGAAAKTYVPQAADVGQTLRVIVTAKNSGGSASATSVPTAAVRKAGVRAVRRSRSPR